MDYPSATGMDDYFQQLTKLLRDCNTTQEFYEAIVNAPFIDRLRTTTLGLGFLAFLLANNKTNMIDRITISNTDIAQGAINMTALPFHDMKVPLNHRGNLVAAAIRTNRYQQTSDWHQLTDPALPAEASRFNQAAAGVSSSFVYPLLKTEPKGAIIFQYYMNMTDVKAPHHNFMFRYTKIVSRIINERKKP